MQSDSVDLNALAREVAREFGPLADRHGSRLSCAGPSRPVIASADPERVRQITRILLDNALTHTPEGTNVTVTTYSVNRRAELTVSDEGTGIPQRVQGRIFERFYTAETAGGSGLGLAIARELAQRMHGRITLTSSRRFTAFTLDLPPGPRRRRPRPPRPPPGRGVRRGALATAAARSAWRCSPVAASSGGRRDRGQRRPPAPSPAPQVVVAGLEPGLRRRHASIARPRRAWSRSARSSAPAARRGLGLRPRHRRRHRHQRPRRHRRIQRRRARRPRRSTSSSRTATSSRPRSSASTPSPTSPC